MNWKRTVVWSVLIFVSALAVGLLLGTGTASTLGVFVSSSVWYFVFLRPVRHARVWHAAGAFLLVEAIDWCIPLMLGARLGDLLDNWDSSARHLAAASVGFVAASLRPRQVSPLH